MSLASAAPASEEPARAAAPPRPDVPDDPAALGAWLRRTADALVGTGNAGLALRAAATQLDQLGAVVLELAQARDTIAQLTARRVEQDAEMAAMRNQLLAAQDRAVMAEAQAIGATDATLAPVWPDSGLVEEGPPVRPDPSRTTRYGAGY